MSPISTRPCCRYSTSAWTRPSCPPPPSRLLPRHRCCAPKVRSFVFHAHYLSIASPCEVLIEHSFADSSNQNWKPADSACKRKNGKRRRSAASALSGAWRRSTTSSGAGSLLGLIYRDQEESTPENGLASNRFQQSDFRIGPV
jgi:hypothetical protein